MATVLVATVGAVAVVLATSSSYFFADDLPNFQVAQRSGLHWSGLTESYYGSFAPGHRVLDWLVFKVGAAPSWTFARLVLLVGYAAGGIAVWRLALELTTRPVAFGVVVLYALSPVHVRAVQWWANGAHVSWSLALTAATLAAGARWLRTRDAQWLIAGGAAQAFALLFYAKPALVPLYLATVVFVRLPGRLTPAGLRAAFREAAPLLAVSAVISVTYVVGVRLAGYSDPAAPATAVQWWHFLRLDWLRGATPLLIGQTIPRDPGAGNDLAMVMGQVVLAGLVVVTVVRRHAAWRAWTAYVVLFAVNALVIGLGRLSLYGATLGLDPRYNAEMAVVLPLVLALAFGEGRSVGIGREDHRSHVHPRDFLVPALAVGLIVSSLVSFHRVDRAWEGRGAKVWSDNFAGSLERLEAGGRPVRVLDRVSPSAIFGTGELSTTMALLGSRAEFVGPLTGRTLASASSGGVLVPTRVVTAVDGTPTSLLRAGRVAPTGSVRERGSALCLEASTEQVSLDIYALPRGGTVVLDLDVDAAEAATLVTFYSSKPGEGITGPVGDSTLPVGADHLQVSVPGPAIDLRMTLRAPQRMCLRRITVRTQR